MGSDSFLTAKYLKMKKSLFLLLPLLLIFSCNNNAVEKPDNLIEEDKMVDIIYDLALLEAIRTTDPVSLEEKNIVANEYIYTKFKIDSLQFVKSNHYYASDVHNYVKIYERVAKRLENNKTKLDTLAARARKSQTVPLPKPTTVPIIPKDSLRIKEKTKRKLSLDPRASGNKQ